MIANGEILSNKVLVVLFVYLRNKSQKLHFIIVLLGAGNLFHIVLQGSDSERFNNDMNGQPVK